jgi:ABC-type maltose transport system permease subunit
MKQKDIPLIIIVVIISAVFSFILSNALISSPKNRATKVEIVSPISGDFKQPDQKYFNAQSIDPTKLIQIGDNNNQQPFNGSH